MNQVKVERKSLQLVGIGALCLACKHEEVMIPNMNDFIFICDNAYSLGELMGMEVDILTTLQTQLQMPTAHDMLLPYLVALNEAPEYPDADEPSELREWCECLTLLGQATYPVVLHGPAALARCVATLGGLLSRGVHSIVTLPDGTTAEGKKASKLLHERVCFLKQPSDWECMEALVGGVEAAMEKSREMLTKCHLKFVTMHPIDRLLETYARDGGRKQGNLKKTVMLKLLNDHYPEKKCKEMKVFRDLSIKEDPDAPQKRGYIRSSKAEDSKEAQFTVAGLSCALGRQLVAEHRDFLEGQGDD